MTDAPDVTPAARDPYRTVLEVGTTLASSLDVDEVTQTIARQVGEALDVQWCDINEYDAEARTMTYVAVWSEELRGVDVDYVGTVVSLGRPARARRRHPQGRPPRDLRRRRGSGSARARGHGQVRRAGGHGDAARVRRGDARGARRGRVAARPALHRRGEAAAASPRPAGRDRARQRPPVPPAAGPGAPARRAAGRQQDARRVRRHRRGAGGRRAAGRRGRGRLLRHGVRVPAAPRRHRLPRGVRAWAASAGSARRRARECVRARGLPGRARDPRGVRGGAGTHLRRRTCRRTAAGRWRSGGRRRA